MDYIPAGKTDVSILFALDQSGLTETDFRISYTRYDEGDGTSFTTTTNAISGVLAAITTAHADNEAKYLSATATDGAKFLFRADFPDAAFAAGKELVICSLYDDADEEVAHRTFRLTPVPANVKEISDDSTAADNLESACANYSVTRGLSGTALPAAAADAAGGLAISDAGGLDIDNNVQDVIETNKLDHLVAVADSDDPVNDSIIAKLASKDATADWSDYNNTTDSLEANRDNIGTNGAALSDLGGMSTGMKAEVESECNDALVAQKLDHLVAVADADDVADDSIIAKMAAKGATADWSDFDNTDDSLQGARDNIGDGAVIDGSTATIVGMLKKMADDNDGADFDAAKDSQWALANKISGIGSVGGSLNFAAEDDNVSGAIKGVPFVGVQSSGTYASTANENGTYHQIDDSGNVIDIVYQFDIGGGRTAVECTWKGFLNGGNDDAVIQAYNGTGWDTIGTIDGKNGSSNDVLTMILLSTHTGTGADLGKVFIRILDAAGTNPDLNTDQLVVSAANIGQTVGYEDGAVWIDTNNGTAGTEDGVNGTADNPVNSYADAITLATSLNLHRFMIVAGSSITLANDHTNDAFIGSGGQWTLALGGQTISGAYFESANISGTGAGSLPTFRYCAFTANASCPPGYYDVCGFNTPSGSPFAANGDGEYLFNRCLSMVAGSGTPYFDFSGLGANTGINVRGWRGGSNWTLDSDCVISMEVLAGGGQTFTTAGADVELRGIFRSATYVLSSAGTIQQIGTTGPITISGTSTATVNLYGISSALSDTSVNTTVNDNTISTVDITNIETDTQDIQSRLPAALVSGKMDSDATSISGDSAAADNLELSLENGTAGYIASDMKYLNGGAQSAADLKDFADDGYDPTTDKVQGVVLVDTTTDVTNDVSADVTKISGNSTQADKLEEAMKGTITGKVNTAPVAATTLLVKSLSNDALADLNQTDLLKNRTLTFTSGSCTGQMVGISAQTASGSDPITLTVSTMVNFAGISIDDEFIIA